MKLPATTLSRPSTNTPVPCARWTLRPRTSMSSPPMSSPRATLTASMTIMITAELFAVAAVAPGSE
jgi:hypothetical protein